LKVEPSRQIIEGESVVLQCIVESSSVVAYQWYRNNFPINGMIAVSNLNIPFNIY